MSFEPVPVPDFIKEISKDKEHMRDTLRYAYMGIDEAKGEDKTVFGRSPVELMRAEVEAKAEIARLPPHLRPSSVITDEVFKEKFKKPPTFKTATETMLEKQAKEHRERLEEIIFGSSKVPKEFLYPNKEDDEKMYDEKESKAHNPEVLTLFDVVVVNKEKVYEYPYASQNEIEESKILIDETVLAKTPKQARGKSGVEGLLAENNYDETKFAIKLSVIIPEVKELND